MADNFLMLAHTFDPDKHKLAGKYVSEKLDGMRCYWDGGINRGKLCRNVPWANIEKDGRLLQSPVATGLWSRYRKPIHAPAWWLDQLPKGIALDGELTMGRGTFQETMSCVKQHVPDGRWQQVHYLVFDTPNCEKDGSPAVTVSRFQERIAKMNDLSEHLNDFIHIHFQRLLPKVEEQAQEIVNSLLEDVTDHGGEGLMVRAPWSWWEPKRTKDLLKIKRMQDAEAEVIGYMFGEETDKGSKLLGLMGSLICRLQSGITFNLSGFTDAERALLPEQKAFEVGSKIPGQLVPADIHSSVFPIGSRVTFRYRELTRDGVPKEARYWRKYD